MMVVEDTRATPAILALLTGCVSRFDSGSSPSTTDESEDPASTAISMHTVSMSHDEGQSTAADSSNASKPNRELPTPISPVTPPHS
jgi:hypothetical protein